MDNNYSNACDHCYVDLYNHRFNLLTDYIHLFHTIIKKQVLKKHCVIILQREICDII